METRYLIIGALAVLLFCSAADGYFYMYGDTQVLPGEKAGIEVCGGWDWDTLENVDISVYELDIGSIYEYLASGGEPELDDLVTSDTPVFKKSIRNLNGCETLELPVLERGFYAVYGEGKEDNSTLPIIVSNLGLVTKTSDTDMLIYSVNVETGKPVEGVSLKVYRDKKIIESGTTDSDGIYTIEDLEDSVDIIGQKGGDIAILSPYSYGGWWENYKIYTYTDRPVYRPGQEVYFKTVLWGIEDGAYKIPQGIVGVEINDPKGNMVYDENFTINEFGSVSGKFMLGDEPPLGYYSLYITAKDGWSGYGSFQVEEYKKPEYLVSVTPGKTQYINGDTISAEISADYYFGSPVTEADVEYTIRKSYWYPPCKGYWCYYEDFSPSYSRYYGGYGEVVTTGTGKTGADGKLKISFVAETDYNSAFVIEAKVTDKSRREVEGSASVTVARGEFDFFVNTDRYSYGKGDNVKISIKSRDINEKPVSAFGKVTIEQHTWNSDYSKEKVVTVYEEDIETSSAGEAVIDFVPDVAGSFYITIEGEDSRGNNITEQGYFYVRDSGPNWDYWASLEIILDQESYKAGDKAKVTINSPVSDFAVLVTVEGDSVYEYFVREFEGTSGTLEIDVKGEYAPNVNVYALVISNMTQYTSSENLIVPPEDKFLDVQILSDKETYAPGEEAVFSIVVKDSEGNPVSAELSLGIVDESLYAIAEESTEEIGKFFYGPRWSSVSTQMSWNSYGGVLYDVAEEAGQTAATASPGAPSVGADDRDMKAEGAANGGFATAETRKYFPDTAFWHAHVKTDANGQATVRVTMPDTLTTWRATARAIDKTFRVGQTAEKTITRKDLLVRLETPRFLTQNDELLISAVVHNYLTNTKDVVVELEATGVDVTGEKRQTISIAPGGDERVDWQVSANTCCVANFTVRALTDEESDAMEIILPILPHGIEEQDSWAGSLSGSDTRAKLNIIVPEDSVYGATELSLMLSPSIASTAFDALEYLADYPYGCVEQTMSAFLPDVYVAQVLRDLDINNDKLEAELPEMVSDGLQKLYKMQHSDGGWGWWENDDTHPYMTAYVVYGLTQAKKAGFSVDSNVLERGLNSLKDQYSGTVSGTDFGGSDSGGNASANTKAYMAYALSFHEEPKSYPKDSDLNDYGRALVALAKLNRGGDTGFPSNLKSSAICDEMVCHWTANTFHYSWDNNDVETTAMVLMALVKTEPDNSMVERAVRWLVSKREGRRWESTKDTATAVFALAEYLKVSRELSPNFVAKIYLNGELVESVKKDDAFDMDNEVKLTPTTGQNELEIVREGEGKLYYSAFLRYFKEEEDIKAKSSGITVKRVYDNTMVKSGEYIRVNLTIDVPSDLEYIILEDPIPAGCEVVDEPQATPYYYWDYYWPYWYSQREVRDEKVVYFMTYLRPGKNEVSYTLRAEVPGSYHVMPATAWNMYDDSIRGHSDEERVDISDKLIVRIGNVVVGDDSIDFTVDALKLAEGDLSGEIVIQVRDVNDIVLRETTEYVSIRESEYSQRVSMALSLADGIYVISYTLTTSDNDVISGSKRIQVGEVPGDTGPSTTPDVSGDKGRSDGTLLTLLAALVILVAAFLALKFFTKAGKGKKEKKAGSQKKKQLDMS